MSIWGRTPVREGEPSRRSGLHLWSLGCRNTATATAAGGGASRDRTGDLKLAKLALSQLSYGPVAQPEWSECSHSPWAAANQSPRRPGVAMVGRVGVEPTTSRLSGVRSNHLSYRPMLLVASSAGGCIRSLGYPRISSGARSRLRPTAEAPRTRKGSQGRTGRRALWRVAKDADASARRLRAKQTWWAE